MTTLLIKDTHYSNVIWESIINEIQDIIRNEYNVSPYISSTFNSKSLSPFRVEPISQSTNELYVGAWHKSYEISINYYLKKEDTESFYKKLYQEAERIYQLFFNNQGASSSDSKLSGFSNGRPEGLNIVQVGNHFNFEVIFICDILGTY